MSTRYNKRGGCVRTAACGTYIFILYVFYWLFGCCFTQTDGTVNRRDSYCTRIHNNIHIFIIYMYKMYIGQRLFERKLKISPYRFSSATACVYVVSAEEQLYYTWSLRITIIIFLFVHIIHSLFSR